MTIHILKVTLAHVQPSVSRRLAIPSRDTLATLHRALQVAFGWQDCHRHRFRVGGVRYGAPGPDDDDLLDEAEVALADVLQRKSARLEYVYDLGDYWLHNISVERIVADAPVRSRSLRRRHRAGTIECLDGANAGPPEDCGGPAGYAEFLKAMNFMNHVAHAEASEWIGSDFNPALCNLADINRRLARLA